MDLGTSAAVAAMDQILKASYGDRGQRQVNELPSDRARAAAIQQDFKAKKQAEWRAYVRHLTHHTLHFTPPGLTP